MLDNKPLPRPQKWEKVAESIIDKIIFGESYEDYKALHEEQEENNIMERPEIYN